MKGIIIAAGAATRLRPLTENTPKCMLPVRGKPILQTTLELFTAHGVTDISIVRGYLKEKILFPDVTYFENTDFWNNNILHSLMFARAKLEEAAEKDEDVVVSYSDILFEPAVMGALVASKAAISAVVDIEWKSNYAGRTDHPPDQAENVVMDTDKRILKIGKDIFTDTLPRDQQGEFIGLWKFSWEGIRIFLKHFDRLNGELKMMDRFQNAKEWQKSYITDIFQEMIDQGESIHAVIIKKKWWEFDTVQDYQSLQEA